MSPLGLRAQADQIHTRPGLTDRQLAVAIVRAVHPTASLTSLAVMCRISKASYAGTWRRLTSQYDPTTPEGVTP